MSLSYIIATCASKSHTSNGKISEHVLSRLMSKFIMSLQHPHSFVDIVIICPTVTDPYPNYYSFDSWREQLEPLKVKLTIVEYKGDNTYILFIRSMDTGISICIGGLFCHYRR